MIKISAVLALTASSMFGALASADNSTTTAVTSSLYVNYFTESQDQCSQVTETAWETVQQIQYITVVPSITVTQWETVQQISYITANCTATDLLSSTDSTVSYSSTDSTVYSSAESSVQDTSSTAALSISRTIYTLVPSTSAVVYTSSIPLISTAAYVSTTTPQVVYVSTSATVSPTTTPIPVTTSEVVYVSTAVENASYQYSGDGTYFTPGLGSCGWNNVESDHIAALNGPQYGNYVNGANCPYCGKCAQVKGPLGTVKVKIVDKCPPCKSGDLDLSPSAFNQIADPVQGRVHISWNFVDC